MRNLILTAMITSLLLGPAALAQQTQRANPPPHPIKQRQVRQQKRIGAGVASGQLTPGETAKLERKEAKLAQEIRQDRKDGGGLTPAERAKIHQKQDRLSRQIYREKHDAQTVPPKK